MGRWGELSWVSVRKKDKGEDANSNVLQFTLLESSRAEVQTRNVTPSNT